MITLFVDASHCPTSWAAGWGAWAISDHWDRGKTAGGMIFQEVSNSSEAELAAIVSACKWLESLDIWEQEKVLMIQSDSHRALRLVINGIPSAEVRHHKESAHFRGKHPSASATEKVLYKELAKVLTDRKIYLRHVKGHASGNSTRHGVNNLCDQIARRNMNKHRTLKGYKLNKSIPKQNPDKERFKA